MHTLKVGDKVRAIPGTRNPDGTDFFSDGNIEDVMPHAIIVQWESTGVYTRHTHNQLEKVKPMTDRENHLANLKAQVENLMEAILELEIHERNERNLAIGQVWKHSTDGTFAVILGLDTEECLVKLSSGNTYPLTKIASNRSAYTYLGEMEDVICVEGN